MISRLQVFCLVFLPSIGLSQWDARGVSGVGMAGVADTNVRVGEGNPGSISLRDGMTIVVGMLPGLFELRELRRYGLAISLAGGGSGIEVHLLAYGGDLFSRYRGSLGIATSVGSSTAMGISIGVSEWRAKGYSALRELDVRVGGIYSEGPLRLGGRLRVDRLGTDRYLASVTAGISFRLTSNAEVASELDQEPNKVVHSRYSFAFQPVWPLWLYLGWQDEPQRIGGGLSLAIGDGEVSYGANWHSVLGWTHGLGLEVRP